ncbi:MAG TPA: hypothetical protein DD733_10375, partial [Clostridiales bacterium]|nr:hypothetical protein [Clostridiales bacterium]
SGIRVHEIEKMMKDAGVKAVKTDLAIYRKAGITELPLGANESLQGILKQGIDSTNGLFENLTQTTAENATMQYINMLDKSWL